MDTAQSSESAGSATPRSTSVGPPNVARAGIAPAPSGSIQPGVLLPHSLALTVCCLALTALAPLSPRDEGSCRRLRAGSVQWRDPDLNRGPLGYEPNELPSCSTPL